MTPSARSLFLVLGFSIAASLTAPLAAATDAKPGKPYAVWVIGEGEKNGHPVKVRWRDHMPDADFKAAHPWCVEITWKFQHDASGNISREESERASDFDTSIEQDIEDEFATEVAGFSDNDHRVWIIYANDRYKVEAALDTMKRDDATLPISYETHEDKNWEGLALVLGTVKERAQK